LTRLFYRRNLQVSCERRSTKMSPPGSFSAVLPCGRCAWHRGGITRQFVHLDGPCCQAIATLMRRRLSRRRKVPWILKAIRRACKRSCRRDRRLSLALDLGIPRRLRT